MTGGQRIILHLQGGGSAAVKLRVHLDRHSLVIHTGSRQGGFCIERVEIQREQAHTVFSSHRRQVDAVAACPAVNGGELHLMTVNIISAL